MTSQPKVGELSQHHNHYPPHHDHSLFFPEPAQKRTKGYAQGQSVFQDEAMSCVLRRLRRKENVSAGSFTSLASSVGVSESRLLGKLSQQRKTHKQKTAAHT